MAINQLTFGGDTLPCTVERYPNYKKPSRKFTRFSVPNRSGDVVIFEDAYNNIEQSYEVYAGGGANATPVAFGDLAEVLYKNGYNKLTDTYDLNHFRLAMYLGGADVENSFNRHGRATITFDCRPERFLNGGDEFIEATNGQTLANPTTFKAKPLIQIDIEPNVTASLTIGGYTLAIESPYTTTHGVIYLDCESMNAYTGTLNRNRYISGNYPVLGSESLVEFGAGFNFVKIKPRWFEL